MQSRKIAFIGAGNMSRCIISGLVKNGYDAKLIIASNPSTPKLDGLSAEFGINTTQDNDTACTFADVIVLSVKPQMMEAVTAELSPASLQNKLFVSLAAGLTVSRLHEMLGSTYPLIRVMPNTPSLLGKGMSGLYAQNTVSQVDKEFAEQMMNAVGKTVWVEDESGINTVIAGAGSSPAYFFLFLEAMQQEVMNMGLGKAEARLLVEQAMLGSAEMVCHNPDLELSELRAQVTSKGGTTAQAVATFEALGLRTIVQKAMQAAVSHAEEMAKQI